VVAEVRQHRFQGRVDGHFVEGFPGLADLALVGVHVARVVQTADQGGQGGQEHSEQQSHGKAEGQQIAQQLFADEDGEHGRSITSDHSLSRQYGCLMFRLPSVARWTIFRRSVY